MDLTMDDLLPPLEDEPDLEPRAAPARPFSVEESPGEAEGMKDRWILPDPEVLEDPVLVPDDPMAPANPFRVEDRPDRPELHYGPLRSRIECKYTRSRASR